MVGSKLYVGVVTAFVVGALFGQFVGKNKGYLAGRLSACKDITSAINSNIPLGLDCKVVDGEVYITDAGGGLIPLNGK